MADSTFFSGQAGGQVQSGVSIDNNRRIFNFGERVAELAPQQSPFFVYLSKVAKKTTDDPVFKFLEQRHQWQRRNFETVTWTWDKASGEGAETTNDLTIKCKYDKYGKISTGNECVFVLPGQILAVKHQDGSVYRVKIGNSATVVHGATNAAGIAHNDTVTIIDGAHLTALDDASVVSAAAWDAAGAGQVIGSAFAEGTGSGVGWEDKLYDREGYCQIFKTAMSLFSNTSLATRYRGISNEYQRVWQEKLMEHKMDIETAMLFGVGSAHSADGATDVSGDQTGQPMRYSWGILPYTEKFGKVYNMSYASSGYDSFLDAMEDFFAIEGANSGNKLVLASRKVITYLNKIGAGSFLNNSVGSEQYRLDVQNIQGSFGHQVTMVNTIFGNLHFVPEPLLRGPWEDYCIAIDMANVSYRPLAGNGVSRDTFIETNIQGNDIDGRKDQIITESGLEISLPETHAIIKFS